MPTVLETLRRLDTGPRGLTETQAGERLNRHGDNTSPVRREASWAGLFLRGVRDPFTAVLLCLALVSAAVASWGTAWVILALVVVSCLLRATGEYRSDRSAAGLRELVAGTATVVRRAGSGEPPAARELPARELVPGDVIRLGPGDLVPADVRLLRARGFTVHQAALTGESAPVTKDAADPPSAAGPAEVRTDGVFGRPQLCFQGSAVATGSGTAVVLETGGRTRFAAHHGGVDTRPRPGCGIDGANTGEGTAAGAGFRRRVARSAAAASVRAVPSAFDRSVHGVSWILIRFMLLTPPLVLMANAALRGRGVETLPFAVAVAVGLTPEMLPVIVTTCLARGALLLARTHGVIVRRLPALHDLGAMDVLCVDKTGTLTEDRPVVDGALDGTGGPDPEVLRWAAANSWWTLQLADLPAPDALDEAILDAAEAVETVDAAEVSGGTPLPRPASPPSPLPAFHEAHDGVDAVPFDPARRLSTAVLRVPGRLGTHTLVVKGAVQDVLDRCVLEPAERGRLLALAAGRAQAGFRVLAVALAERPARARPYTPADERGLTFRGLVLLRDALAPTAGPALSALGARGVTVKVLTGDHPGTAVRACRDLGVAVDPGQVLTADLVDAMDDAQLASAAVRTAVFARCAPEHKARITAALRSGGHTVGFLGDGVNDLPALRAADVGIAPRDAVAVVREGADAVLAEKDLTAIDHAIAAGRHAGGNIATYLRVTLSSNLGNVIAMLAAGLLLPFLPMLPAQVLVQNLCFDAAQLAFAHDRPDPAVLRRPTVLRPRELLRLISGFGAINAVADLATFGVLALAARDPDGLDDASLFHSGWFTENLLTQALVMVLLRVGRRSAGRGAPGPVGLAALGLSVTGLLLPFSPLGAPLGLTALPVTYYALLTVVLALYATALRRASRRCERGRDA